MEFLADGVSSPTVEKMENFDVLDGVTHENDVTDCNGSNHESMSRTLIVGTELTSFNTSFEIEKAGVGPDDIVEHESSSIEEKVCLEHGSEVENVKGSVLEVGNVKESVLEVEMNSEKGVENVEACDSSMVLVDAEKFDGVISVLKVNRNAENNPDKRETNIGLSTLVDIKNGRGFDDKAYLNDNDRCKTLKISKYYTGDFVWGKIKNHPWWPGQIYESSDASELALKHEHMNRYLVAYSGDGTFAWCKPFQLKPFPEKYVYFSKQSNGKALVYALKLVLEQIGELVEWNMTCSCKLKRHQAKLSRPIADSWGVKDGVLMPINAQSKLNQFEPAQILADLKHIARIVSVDNMLEFILMKSKLSAFYRAKGGHQLPVYHFPQNIIGLEDNNPNSGKMDVPSQTPFEIDWLSAPKTTGLDDLGHSSLQKNLFTSKKLYKRRKQMSIADAQMNIEPNKFNQTTTNEDDSMKIKKAPEIGKSSRESKKSKYLSPPFPFKNPLSRKKYSYSKKESESEFMSEPSSIKIGEKMTVAASKLFSSSPLPLFKCSAAKHKKELSKEPDAKRVLDPIITKASPNEMLSELCDAAAGHQCMKGPKSLGMTMVFFSTFRDATYLNGPFYKLFHKHTSDKKRKCAGSESDRNAPESISIQKRTKKHEPNGISAALFIEFSPGVSLPSKDDLIAAYRVFGPLNEEYTRVMVTSSCAEAVFYSREDAEQAFNHSMSTKKDDTVTYSVRYYNHGLNAPALDTSEFPSLKFLMQNPEIMALAVDTDFTSEEMRNKYMAKVKTLTDKVSKM